MKKAMIAMSGGVDSSVAAYLTVQKGYDCIGATMKLFNNEDINISEENACCAPSDIDDAKSVAHALGMEHCVFNFTSGFRQKVIDNFVYSYENGLTPNPCVECNRYLKFEKLFEKAEELSYDYIVTGHYARIEESNGRYLLKKALDPSKDQSYVLYSLTQKQLSHALFPLGALSKPQVREIADSQGFVTSHKHESQDICFVPDGDYAAFIEKYTKKSYPPGDFVDICGNKLGTHKGIIRYTVGQRKGLGISAPYPLYVSKVEPSSNTVVLCKNDELFSKTLIAKNINLISVDSISSPMRVKAKVRYRHQEQPATVTQLDSDTIKVTFDEAQRAITKGQSVVLYDNDLVVGGGIITETE